MTLLQNFNSFSNTGPQRFGGSLSIAIVTETWPPEINGVAMTVLQLCKGLQQRGHRILLIRPYQPNECQSFKPSAECLVAASSIPKYPDLRFGYPQRGKVARALTQFKPDIVHIVTEGPLGLAALNIARQYNYPVSSGFHSPFHEFSRFFGLKFLIKPVQHYLRWFHNRTDLTCVPSSDTQQALVKAGFSCPLAMVSRGVDSQHFHPQKRWNGLREQWLATPQTTVMLYVGRLSPEKNIGVVIEAYQQAKANQPQRDFKLVIVGDGPDRLRLQNLSSDAIFAGMQTGEQLARHYASADVFLFASEVETFGNVVLEALASGLPVLAYDYACTALTVQHGINGWACRLSDATQFQQLAAQLPALAQLQKMGAEARKTVQQFGWFMVVDQFEFALRTTAEKHQSLYSTAWNKAMIPLFIT
jgi:glycosyltransferase involved in cell wall biosynthesis